MEQNRVYVTGHKHPDTDSIAAAIGYAFYKRANGVKAIPCRLGKLSAETKYLLERFGFEEPMLLMDARKRLNEIDLDEPFAISDSSSIQDTLQLMAKNRQTNFGVVDDDGAKIDMTYLQFPIKQIDDMLIVDTVGLFGADMAFCYTK